MQRIWRNLLRMLVRTLRASAGVGERAARAIDRRLAAEREPESPGGELPAHWLAAVERREPPAQWMEHVRRRAPGVRFQHYRAASAPPSPAVRRWPARAGTPAPRVAPAGDHAPAPPRPARAAAPRMAPAGQAASLGAPPRAERRGTRRSEQSTSQPESEPDAQSGAAAEAVAAAAPAAPAERQAPSSSEAAGVEPGPVPRYFPVTWRSAAARLLARPRRFLTRRTSSTPDGESPGVPVWPRDTAPHAGLWPPPEPLAEEAPAPTRAEPVLSPWPPLPDETLRQRAPGATPPGAGPGEPGVARPARVDPWPSLPRIPYGAGEGTPAGEEPDADPRALRRRRRLDDEQRGLLWNGSIY